MSALPSDPASDLAAAEAARRRLTSSLRLPTWFHISLGVAVAVQIGTAGVGLSQGGGPGLWVAAAGVLFFLAVAGCLALRFRRLNRVRVDGLFSRALMGTSARSSLAYCAGFAGALWAAFEGQWWLAGVAAAAGGLGYAVSARLWWRDYLRDPATQAQGESWTTLALVGCAALAGAAALVLAR
ncbi:hypothetical protein [Nocardioides dilutus]